MVSKGAAVAWPIRVVPAKYSTLVMGLPGEVALAVSLIGARATLVAPFAGVVIEMVGASLTIIVTGAPSADTPLLSVIRGVMIKVPATFVPKVPENGEVLLVDMATPLGNRYCT